MQKTVDLAAVSRVARRVELTGVRLAAILAKCDSKVVGTSLEPEVNLDCKLGEHNESAIEVVCDYTFIAHSGETQAIESAIQYLLIYEISGAQSPSAEDMAEFARANGALHSWPFVRELLDGLTSRMGYPPYTLPVMHFNTSPPPTNAPAPVENTESAAIE